MSVGNLSHRERLGDELRAIRRDEARISQQALSEASGVGTTTIKQAESGAQLPKADTLRLLADGLATYRPGRRDTELAQSYYERLLRAAGYIADRPAEQEAERRRSVEDLTDEEVGAALRRWFEVKKVPVAFLAAVEDWEAMSPSAQRFLLNQFEEAQRIDQDIKAAAQRDTTRSTRRSGS